MSAAAEDPLFVYDEVAYPTPILAVQTPSRIRAAGLVFGFRAARCETASVLEIGCGDGLNLAGIAAVAPQSRCVGFDLSLMAIERGQAFLAQHGVQNVDLHHGNILDYPRDGEKFDYIITHGVYAWIPPDVRTALLELIAARLAPGGVAYVSYDCLPAASVKYAINRFLVGELKDVKDPVERIQEAMRLIVMLAANQHPGSRLKKQVDSLAEQMADYDPGYFYHDFLAEFYHPVGVADLAHAAEQKGLKLAGDVALTDLFTADLDDPAREMLARKGSDLAARAALLDMLRGGQTFRRSLLVRADAPPPPAADRLGELSFTFLGDRESDEDEFGPFTRYKLGDDAMLTAREDPGLQIMNLLYESSPREFSFADLLAATGRSAEDVLPFLEKAATLGLIWINATPQNFVIVPGERPLVPPLIRSMIAQGDWAITLRHAKLIADSAPTRGFITLCDGTRTRAELAAAMTERFGEPIPVANIEGAIADLGPRRIFAA